nr:TetR/AcrR family transcriptional regulator [uncultured Sphingomonas sp.]
MLDAAESLFLELGYEQTTLASVVRRSGGSLATLYEHFGNKQGLLRAMIARVAEANRPPLPDSGPWEPRRTEQLRHYAHELYSNLTNPRKIALTRIVMTEALRDPDFARSVYNEIHRSAIDELAMLFTRWTEQGHAKVDRPMAAADLFVAMVVGDTKLRILCADTVEPLTSEELDWRLQGFITQLQID